MLKFSEEVFLEILTVQVSLKKRLLLSESNSYSLSIFQPYVHLLVNHPTM